MVLVKAESEERLPTKEEFTEMGDFNAEIVKAGIMLNADGLQQSSKGVRINFSNSETKVEKGPFPLENLVAGYWVWKLDSMDEAISWAKKIPFKSGNVEIRQIAEVDDLGDGFTDELKKKEQELRKMAEENAK